MADLMRRLSRRLLRRLLRIHLIWPGVLAGLLFALSAASASAPLPNPSPAPFRLPFSEPAGPDSWLLTQTYGNTLSAYRVRANVYQAGQGMHFGIDFGARCGYPIVAIGDGIVTRVDAPRHGAGPHNLMIDHPNGYASFYGHMLQRSHLEVGQAVLAGELVGYVGDPDETCLSRPHLHLEIRNAGRYTRAYNPVPLIAADWDSLSLAGPFSQGFVQDLSDPRRWQRLDDQPDILFGGPGLNDYPNPWPPEWRH
jgi:murein DD-endopeptidase MepM/ murein hydrolase activator NlpD